MSDDRSLMDLVTRARNGDRRAWDDLAGRHAPLAWSICRAHQLSGADAGDFHPTVWPPLTSQLDTIRHLARNARTARRPVRVADGGVADQRAGLAMAFAHGRACGRRLLSRTGTTDQAKGMS